MRRKLLFQVSRIPLKALERGTGNDKWKDTKQRCIFLAVFSCGVE
ncbi:MAG: hypothetical protein P8Y80_17265 [Acidobacteriota bacterium]